MPQPALKRRSMGFPDPSSTSSNGQKYAVIRRSRLSNADRSQPRISRHLHQLCGPAATYRGGPYSVIHDSGFVASYVASGGKDPAEVMKCFRPEQLPVLNALAREFAVCDNWHAAIQQELSISPDQRQRFVNRVAGIKTRSDVLAYMAEL
jgi:hypothetical protein